MAKDEVKQILNDIFSDRRYCLDCKAMTPIRKVTSARSAGRDEVFSICLNFYEDTFRNLQVKETYGMAIFHEGAKGIVVAKNIR